MSGNGLIIYPENDLAIRDVLAKGCWTETCSTCKKADKASDISDAKAEWFAVDVALDGSRFTVQHKDTVIGDVIWSQIGYHHVDNALNAIAAACHVGVEPDIAIDALRSFQGVKRRLDVCGRIDDIVVYDDFAHHPTAIASVLTSLRARLGPQVRIMVAVQFGSYTMRSGCHELGILADALKSANIVKLLKPANVDWGATALFNALDLNAQVFCDSTALLASLTEDVRPGDHVVFMSNKSFDGICEKFIEALELKRKCSPKGHLLRC